MCELQSYDTKSLVRSIWEQPGKHGKLNSAVTVFLKCVCSHSGHGWVWLKALRDQTFLRNFSQRTSSLKICYIRVAANRVREMPAYHFEKLPMQVFPTSFEFQASSVLMEHCCFVCGVNTFLWSVLELQTLPAITTGNSFTPTFKPASPPNCCWNRGVPSRVILNTS